MEMAVLYGNLCVLHCVLTHESDEASSAVFMCCDDFPLYDFYKWYLPTLYAAGLDIADSLLL
jgi:hypothetical protein